MLEVGAGREGRPAGRGGLCGLREGAPFPSLLPGRRAKGPGLRGEAGPGGRARGGAATRSPGLCEASWPRASERGAEVPPSGDFVGGGRAPGPGGADAGRSPARVNSQSVKRPLALWARSCSVAFRRERYEHE